MYKNNVVNDGRQGTRTPKDNNEAWKVPILRKLLQAIKPSEPEDLADDTSDSYSLINTQGLQQAVDTGQIDRFRCIKQKLTRNRTQLHQARDQLSGLRQDIENVLSESNESIASHERDNLRPVTDSRFLAPDSHLYEADSASSQSFQQGVKLPVIDRMEDLLERFQHTGVLLQQRERAFTKAADDMLELLDNFGLPAGQDSESVTSPSSPEIAPLLEQYFAKAGDVQILGEQLVDLDLQYRDACILRGLLMDQERAPSVPDDEFNQAYQRDRVEIEKDLDYAIVKADELKARCVEMGLPVDARTVSYSDASESQLSDLSLSHIRPEKPKTDLEVKPSIASATFALPLEHRLPTTYMTGSGQLKGTPSPGNQHGRTVSDVLRSVDEWRSHIDPDGHDNELDSPPALRAPDRLSSDAMQRGLRELSYMQLDAHQATESSKLTKTLSRRSDSALIFGHRSKKHDGP